MALIPPISAQYQSGTFADIHVHRGDALSTEEFAGRAKEFGNAVKVDRRNIEARKNFGFLLALLGRREEAIRSNLDVLKLAPQDSPLLTRISVLHFLHGEYNEGLEFGRLAYHAMPASKRGSLDAFIEKLKNQRD